MKRLNAESNNQLSPCRRNLFAFGVLLIFILIIYSNTFDASWHFDDRQNIRENKVLHVDEITGQGIKDVLFSSHPKKDKIYRPVACLSLAVNYYFGQFNVFGYHLVNTFIHVLASFFLYLFIYHTLNLPLLRSKYGSASYSIALLAAVFWAVNPVQTQAVTYIVQRMASMAAMFTIMAMYFFLKGRTAVKNSPKVLHYSVCVFCGLLAVGSKENAGMLPFSILLFDLFLIQGLTKTNIKRSGYIFLLLLIFPLVMVLVLKGPDVVSHTQKLYEARPFTLGQAVLTQPRVILFYLSLLFYPVEQRLSITHDIQLSNSLFDPPSTIVAILVLLGIVGACLLKSKKWPFIAYCILFFFMNHVIEGSVFGLELIFEHRNYLPSMLLFAPVAILLVKTIQYYSVKPVMQGILAVFIGLVLIGFGNSTFLRNRVWKTSGTLWADAVEKAPDVIRPHLNLGNYYFSKKINDMALAQYSEGSTKRPVFNTTDEGLIFYNIGLIHHRMGEIDKAIENYGKAVAAYPGHADSHNNMGTALHKQGHKEEAETELKKAIVCKAKHIKAHRNLALFSLKDGHLDKAVLWINKALQLEPDNSAILGAAGYCYRLKGSFGRAFALFEKTVSFDKYDPKVDLYIAEIYFKRKIYDQAVNHVRKFAARAEDKDLRGYVQGTYKKEDEIEVIRPYKKMVLFALSRAYENQSSYLNEKADYIKTTLADTK